jgi:uncharacterized membrane protein YqaE (UPF0057 family)
MQNKKRLLKEIWLGLLLPFLSSLLIFVAKGFLSDKTLIDLFLPEKCQIIDEAKIRTDNYE